MIHFFQLAGGVLGIAIAGAVFVNQLTHNINVYAPGLDPQLILAIKMTLTTIKTLPDNVKAQIIQAYIKSLGEPMYSSFWIDTSHLPRPRLHHRYTIFGTRFSLRTFNKEPQSEGAWFSWSGYGSLRRVEETVLRMYLTNKCTLDTLSFLDNLFCVYEG